ncbi:putative holin-like toxin [Nicoliella spurrieriana]
MEGNGLVTMSVYQALILMLTFGMFLIALLDYINKRSNKKAAPYTSGKV